MPDSTPVWVGLPDAIEPVHGATLFSDGMRYRFQYDPAYLAGTGAAADRPALDPVNFD